MTQNKSKCMENFFGTESFTLDEITTSAVIVLRNPETPDFAVLNLPVSDAPKAYEIVEDFVNRYISQFSMEQEVTPRKVEAAIIGGDYLENRIVDQGLIVSVPHTLARRRAEDALKLCYVRVTYVNTDRRAVKSINVTRGGKIDFTERVTELNAKNPLMSETDYEMTIGRHKE